MPYKKGQSGNPKGKPKGAKNKPKPLIQKLIESFGGSISEADLVRLSKDAMKHATGDIIVTEGADGQSLTAKCVSDPRLLLGCSKMIVDAEMKKWQPSGSLPPILDGLRKELENYGEAE